MGALATWVLPAAGLALWAALIAVPGGVVSLEGAFSPPENGTAPFPVAEMTQVGDVVALGVRSFALAGGVAAAAILLGYIPGRIFGAARRHRPALLLLLLMPMLLPRYVLYYAWSLLLVPTNSLGAWISSRPELARPIGTLTAWMVMVLWYWPLAALVIGQGWRTMDREAWDMARLETGRLRRFTHVTLPLLRGSLLLAFGVCFAMSLAEFGAFHLAGVRTIGTELAVLYELTGSGRAVLRSAWPLAIPAAIVAFALWRRSRDWAINPPLDRPTPPIRKMEWAVLGVLMLLSLFGPLGLLVGNLSDVLARKAARDFVRLHRDGLFWSMAVSGVGGAAALLMAAGACWLTRLKRAERSGGPGRFFIQQASALVNVTVFLAMFLPGSLIAVSLLRTMVLVGVPGDIRQGWWVVSCGLAVRGAGLGLILLHLTADSRERHLTEMAAVDGASGLAAWRYVHLPRTWPVLAGAFLLVTMLGMTELSATMVLLPAGLPNFAQRLLNQMHYAREQDVIISCLALGGTYLVLGAVAVTMLLAKNAKEVFRARVDSMVEAPRRPLSRRGGHGVGRTAVTLLLLCAIGACVGGCDRDFSQKGRKTTEPGEVRVVVTIGRTGRGPGEFLYPRAIAIAPDGSVVVVDKTGRIQWFLAEKLKSAAGLFYKNLGYMRMPLIEAGKPTGLTFWPKGPTSAKKPGGYLYVADTHYHRVVVLLLKIAKNTGGEVVGQFGKFGEEGGSFIYPTDIAFALDGRMFVSEYGGNDRVSVFEAPNPDRRGFGDHASIPGDGTLGAPRFLGSFGSPGSGRGQFRRPAALCVDEARGRLYVADACNHRIAVYDLRSERTSPPDRGTAGAPTAEGPDPTAIPALIGYIGSPGRERGELRYPYDLALRDDGVLVVCEYGNNRIQLFGTDGRSLGTHGRPGRGEGELAYPWGVAVDGEGKIYVVDAGNNRLQVWEL